MLDSDSRNSAVSLLPPNVQTTSGNGSAVASAAYAGRGKVVVDLGSISGTTPTLDVVIQDSPDGSTDWQTLATVRQITDADADSCVDQGVDLEAARGYVRASYTIAGTTPNFVVGVVLIATKQRV